jgi:hypothetical protein
MQDPIGWWQFLLAGLGGGIVMAMVGMMVTAMMGLGLFAMPQSMGEIIVGPDTAEVGAGKVVMIGMMLHMMMSIVFGLVYGVIYNFWTHEIWATGIIYGLVLWIVNFYIVGAMLPAAKAMARKTPVMLGAMTHAAFGATAAAIVWAFAGAGR